MRLANYHDVVYTTVDEYDDNTKSTSHKTLRELASEHSQDLHIQTWEDNSDPIEKLSYYL